MISADAAKLAGAFHLRASIVGNWDGEVSWQTLEEFMAECADALDPAGRREFRVERLSLQGDTAMVTIGGYFDGYWYTDDLSMLRSDGVWRIVHKTFYAHPNA
jgi:hypothetical protein